MPNSELSRPLRIFLCHASEDKPGARDLYRRLIADGFDVWLDEESLLGGQDWRKEIPKAIRNSDAVLVCLSRKAIHKSGYVQKEIGFALDVAEEQPEDTNFVIPVRFEECDSPQRLQNRQWVSFFEQSGYDKLIRALEFRASQVAYRQSISRNVSALTDSEVTVGPEKHSYDPVLEPYRFAKIVISRTWNSVVDASTVSEVHQLLSSHPGPDRFCFLIKARGEPLQLDFPNDTTTLDDKIIDQLKSMHGIESVQISMSL